MASFGLEDVEQFIGAINIWEQKVGDTTNEARTFGLLGCGLAGVGSANFVG